MTSRHCSTALVADRVVLDTTRAQLLHETGIQPVAYVSGDVVVADGHVSL